MHRLWRRYSEPLTEALAPRRILQIGASTGANTEYLLEYCQRTGAVLDIIEPEPKQALHDLLRRSAPAPCSLHVGESVAGFPALEAPDLVLLNCDPNWQTVFLELSLLSIHVGALDKPMPIVLAHACGWPYARRDMYRDPLALRDDRRRPFAYRGILPGVVELVNDGVNARCANALTEGGPQNGVLTAVEDFVAVTAGIRLWVLPFLGGLGILAPDVRLSDKVLEAIEGFFSPDSLLEIYQALQLSNSRARAEMRANRTLLAERSHELTEARVLLKQRSAQLEKLRHQRGA